MLFEALRRSELEGLKRMAKQLHGHMASYQERGPGGPSEEAMREYVMRVQELYM